MGQGASGLPGAPGGPPGRGGPGGDKKDEKKKKKFEPRPPMRTGKKKRKKGPSVAVRTPQGVFSSHDVRSMMLTWSHSVCAEIRQEERLACFISAAGRISTLVQLLCCVDLPRWMASCTAVPAVVYLVLLLCMLYSNRAEIRPHWIACVEHTSYVCTGIIEGMHRSNQGGGGYSSKEEESCCVTPA